MNLKNYYWYFTSVLSNKFCDEVIKYALMHKDKLAVTGDFKNKKVEELNKKELNLLKNKRNSDIVWLDDNWIYKEIHPYIHIANEKAGWNFQWNYSESCQFTKYKINQYYNWHCDSWNEPYSDINDKNTYKKIRKLSVTCQLSDGSEYKGGELEFDTKDYEPDKRKEKQSVIRAKEILPKGSIIVFPSFVWHRVKPVTEGTRYSLVMWNLGNPYI
jgi:PKHD-type hydroxylase